MHDDGDSSRVFNVSGCGEHFNSNLSRSIVQAYLVTRGYNYNELEYLSFTEILLGLGWPFASNRSSVRSEMRVFAQ